jgi:transcriptional regulator with XRE-family HTH domain
MLEVGAALREARKAAGLSQSEIAACLGAHVTTVSRIETGAMGTTLDAIERWAKCCGVEAAVVLDRDELQMLSAWRRMPIEERKALLAAWS